MGIGEWELPYNHICFALWKELAGVSVGSMNELVNLVVQRTGLSQEDALKAVTAVLDILKQRLPAPIASHIDGLLAGGSAGFGAEAGELLKGALGGMFGEKK